MSKAIVLHSGGLDSSVALANAVKHFGAKNVKSLGIHYGQRHEVELKYAEIFCEMFDVVREIVSLPPIKASRLTDPNAEIPKVSYDDIVGLSPAYVPFRNGLMLANAASIAQAEGFDYIVYGAHSEDALNWAYPDCTPEFNGAMANAIYTGTDRKVQLLTPLQWMLKSDIVVLGASINAPLHLTWSCYLGGEVHCGECPTCRARKKAFSDAGVDDPTVYAV